VAKRVYRCVGDGWCVCLSWEGGGSFSHEREDEAAAGLGGKCSTKPMVTLAVRSLRLLLGRLQSEGAK
jgi:hypothetical protein